MVGADNDTSDGDRVSTGQRRRQAHFGSAERAARRRVISPMSLSVWDASISPLFVSPLERSKALPVMDNGKNDDGEIYTICNLA